MDASQLLGQARRRPLLLADVGALDFSKGGGLLPAIVQHAASAAVLMLGSMSRESLVVTMARRRVVFFSRSKGRLWEKGEISGHSLEVEQIFADCDGDALLVSAWPRGPVCHLGSGSCFGDSSEDRPRVTGILTMLEEVISERMTARPEGSYTAKLLQSGRQHIAQKVGEEGVAGTPQGTRADPGARAEGAPSAAPRTSACRGCRAGGDRQLCRHKQMSFFVDRRLA
jgi:phosphoribosyl-ATP pyrophosphohydrolase/phosphoribosyl-AMP cyclohydrolase